MKKPEAKLNYVKSNKTNHAVVKRKSCGLNTCVPISIHMLSGCQGDGISRQPREETKPQGWSPMDGVSPLCMTVLQAKQL